MSTSRKTEKKTIRVEIKHRNGEVTIAANNGIVVNVKSNDLGTVLGAVFAANMLYEHNRQEALFGMFDITMEINQYDYNGQKSNSELSV